MENKTHYRKVFKSDHLGCADLEDFIEAKKPLVFKIKEVKQEIGVSVAGKKGNHNIAYFHESIKPLVLNATNSKVVKLLSGGSPFVEDWKDVVVEMYIDENVKMKGEIVGGVRLKKSTQSLPPLTKDKTTAWANSVAHLKRGGLITDIEKRFYLSNEVRIELQQEAL